MADTKIKKIDTAVSEELMKELSEIGVLYSHKRSKAHPNMRPFIGTSRYEMDILDARAVLNSIDKAGYFLKKVSTKKESSLILFVGTTPPVKDLIKTFAEKFNQPYVVNRWLGGTLTNFSVIKNRIEYYQKTKKRQEEGELKKYTKKEQLDFANEINKLSYKFEGLINLTRLPDVIFIVNAEAENTALKEAQKLEIPIVAVIDSNDDPDQITYPIIANDHNKSSIEWVMNTLENKLIEK